VCRAFPLAKALCVTLSCGPAPLLACDVPADKFAISVLGMAGAPGLP